MNSPLCYIQGESKNFTPLKLFDIQTYAQLESFIQLFLNLMKLCHIMSIHAENFPFLL